MNFKRLGSTAEKSTTSTDSKLVRTFRSVKNWFYPKTAEGKRLKITLFKDLGIFIAATAAIVIFRDEIKRALEEDPAAAQGGFQSLGL